MLKTPEIPAEFRFLSVVRTTHHVAQKRISREDFSLSKTSGGVREAYGENASSADQKRDGNQRSTRPPDQGTQQASV
jgi:hypothetical protein